MSAKVLIGAMVVASAALIGVVATRSHDPPPPPPAAPPPEKPWLSKEAAAQIVTADGSMGPVFAGVRIGGPVPAPEVRQRIAELARANDVQIDLDIAGGLVTAVRFAVTYGGCCGYEGADALGLRIGRHKIEGPGEDESAWLDDWSTASDDGVFMQAHVHVNRVQLRWQRELTIPELLDRAEALLGRDPVVVASEAKGHWREVEPGARYALDVPYAAERGRFEQRYRQGIQAVVFEGRITTVEVTIRTRSEDPAATEQLLRGRWGKPREDGYQRTWARADRTITGDLNDASALITITARLPGDAR